MALQLQSRSRPLPPAVLRPCRAAANDKDSGKRLTAANCSSVKVMGFLTQLLMTPYGQPGKARDRGCMPHKAAGRSLLSTLRTMTAETPQPPTQRQHQGVRQPPAALCHSTVTAPHPPAPAPQQEAVGHEMLVDLLLRELLVCSALDVPKPYLAALCRTAASLEVFPVGEAEGGVSTA